MLLVDLERYVWSYLVHVSVPSLGLRMLDPVSRRTSSMRLVCCVWWCPSPNDLGHVRMKSLAFVWTVWKVAVRSAGSVPRCVVDGRSELIQKIALGCQ